MTILDPKIWAFALLTCLREFWKVYSCVIAAPVNTVAIMMVAMSRIAVLIVTSTCHVHPPSCAFGDV